MRAVALCLVVAACAGGPRHASRPPAPLVPVGPPVAAAEVTIELQALDWWTAAGTDDAFILQLPAPDEPPPPARALGATRSAIVALTGDEVAAVRCAFMIVPMGDARPCGGPRDAALAIADPLVGGALTDLQVQAAGAGIRTVGRVRCFARRSGAGGRLWCEGEALAREPVAVAWSVPGARPVAQELDEVTTSRLALVADASAGVLGRSFFLGADLGLRYRPLELSLHVLSLPDQRVGLGGALVVRHRPGRSLTDLVAGVSSTAAMQNGATNPDVAGVHAVFVGVGAQTLGKWFLRAAQPYVSLRAGLMRGDPDGDGAVRTGPMVELRLGLSTPER